MSEIHSIFSTQLNALSANTRYDDEAVHPTDEEITTRLTAARGDIVRKITASEIVGSGRDADGVQWYKMSILLKRKGMSGDFKVEAAFNEYNGWQFSNLELHTKPKRS